MFLVCTADRRFWQNNKKILFLGEWCKLDKDKETLKKIDYKTLDYHWDNRKKLDKDYEYLIDLYERTINELTPKLNKIHNKNYSVRGWKIIVGIWLSIFIQVFYDRYSSILKAKKSYKISQTVILNDKDILKATPKNDIDFDEKILGDLYNHTLFSIIIKKLNLFPFKIYNKKIHYVSKQAKKSKINLIQNIISSIYNFIKSRFHIKYYFYSSNIKKYDLWKLETYLKQPISLDYKSKYKNDLNINKEKRKELIIRKAETPFEKLLYEVIPFQMPMDVVEGFDYFQLKSKLFFPSSVEHIFTAYNKDTSFKIWVADKIMKNAKFHIIQHGGGFGLAKKMASEDYFIGICDKFLTWGWKNNHKKELTIPASVNIGRSKIKEKLESEQILLLGHSLARYSYKICSEPLGPVFKNFIYDNIKFFKLLSPEIKKTLKFRPLPAPDYGWNQIKRIKRNTEEFNISDLNTNFLQEIKSSKLIISCSNTTGFLETMALDIPTILIFSPKYWELNERFKIEYKLLKENQILHTDIKSAAKHINEVGNNPFSWWNSKKTINARIRFTQKFAFYSKDWILDWKKTIDSISLNEV